MKSAEEWLRVYSEDKKLSERKLRWSDGSLCSAIQADALSEPIKMLKKYQARYHGAEHAQKDWEHGETILNNLRAKLPKEVEL